MEPIKKFSRIALGAVLGTFEAPYPLFHAQEPHHARHAHEQRTATPIKHVILIIGENRAFVHVFGTFKPRKGQTVHNLLSEGIINANGTPGPNFSKAAQWRARDTKT